MLTLTPLRSAIAGLCLFAGMASAQAAPGGLAIQFEEDVASGQLKIIFSGQTVNPFAATNTYDYGSPLVTVTDGTIAVGEAPFYANPARTGWTVHNMQWLAAAGINPASSSGTGGYYYSSTLGSTQVEIFSTTYAATGDLFIWDGEITYNNATLLDLGLSDGDFRTITFTLGGESISVDWHAVVIPVPEPATYALVLGLGVAGVALVRRRRASR